MARKPITLAGRYFPTKGALELEVQRVLHTTPIGTRLSGVDDVLIRAVLAQHPWADLKMPTGIQWIEIRRTNYHVFSGSEKDRGFYIIRPDGSSTDISYIKCLNPNAKGLTWRLVTNAYREAVRDQTAVARLEAFKDSAVLTCPILNIEFDEHTSAVDHMAPDTFAALMIRFGEMSGWRQEDWEASISETQDNTYFRTIVDVAVMNRWQAFHKEHAKLRVISKRANLLIGTRGVLSTDPEHQSPEAP